jgi:hypothetical protein
VEGAAQESNRRAMKDLHRTPVIRLEVLFHAFTVKKGFKAWVVGKKIVSILSKSACKSDPSLLVCRVFFPKIVLQSKITAYVPSASIRDILIHPDIDGRRSKWIVKILEFELEIRPTKLIKGQGLAKLLAEANCQALGVSFINECSEIWQDQLSDADPQEEPPLERCPWYKDVIYFLQELRPPDGLQRNKARALKLKEIKYCLVDQVLYWKDPLGVILKCMNPQEAQRIIVEFHDSLCGGNHFGKP